MLLLLATLGGFVAQRLATQRAGAAEVACERNVAAVNRTIEKWFFDKGRWPADDLSDIAHDRAYFPSGPPRCPVTGAPYKMNRITHRVSCRRH